MSQISNEASADENQGDDLSPFELLPREIRLKILELVVEEIEHFIVFKWFWRLRRVNKEFYSMFRSDYAKQHFLKWPCSVYFNDCFIEYQVNVYIHWPISYTKMQTKSVLDPTHEIQVKSEKGRLMLRTIELPKYFKDKPFDIAYTRIHTTCPGDETVPSILKMANQTSEKLFLEFTGPSFYTFTMFGGVRQRPETKKEIEDLTTAGKIVIKIVTMLDIYRSMPNHSFFSLDY
ncbi:unnamed protein product [Auanema sp. JU1783]|nr:unnamed protein product [Auanema sp. JU1783]